MNEDKNSILSLNAVLLQSLA